MIKNYVLLRKKNNCRIPTKQEMQNISHLSIDEIESILKMSKSKIRYLFLRYGLKKIKQPKKYSSFSSRFNTKSKKPKQIQNQQCKNLDDDNDDKDNNNYDDLKILPTNDLKHNKNKDIMPLNEITKYNQNMFFSSNNNNIILTQTKNHFNFNLLSFDEFKQFTDKINLNDDFNSQNLKLNPIHPKYDTNEKLI